MDLMVHEGRVWGLRDTNDGYNHYTVDITDVIMFVIAWVIQKV